MEKLCQVTSLFVVCFVVAPRRSWNEHRVWHVGTGSGNFQAEDRVRHRLHVVQRAIVDGVYDGPRIFQVDACAHTVGAARPACVDQPRPRAMFLHLLGQQLCIMAGMPDHKGRPKTARKGGLWLLNADLCTGNFRRIAADEMIHRLLPGKLADRGQHAKGIRGQQDDIVGMVPHGGDFSVGNVAQRVGCPRVLCDGRVTVVDRVGDRIVDDIFQDGAELDGAVDLRLFLR